MKYSYSIFIAIFILGCSITQKTNRKRCNKIFKNDFSAIRNEKFETVSNENDTVVFNEVRYDCVFSAFYSSTVMYDKLGIWDQALFPENSRHPVLMWEDLNLFGDHKKYDVFTFGIESRKEIYASVMVFDQENNDLLAEDSEEKQKLTQFFGELLRNHDLEKEGFYEVYWKKVDPEFWEKHHGS